MKLTKLELKEKKKKKTTIELNLKCVVWGYRLGIMFQTTIALSVITIPFLFHLFSTNPESQHSSTSSSMEVCPGPRIDCKINLHKFHAETESIPTNTIDDGLKLISSSIQQVIVDAKVRPLSYEKGLPKDDILQL